MGIEFLVGHADHHKMQDFLARDHDGVSAVILDAKAGSLQEELADFAAGEGRAVLRDPRTDRLEHPGLHLEQLPGYRSEGYDLKQLAANPGARAELTERVLATQVGLVTAMTPAYFFGIDKRALHLNFTLAEAAQAQTDEPVRPIVTLRSRTPIDLVEELASEYMHAGFEEIDLRISPLGGEKDSLVKVRFAFAAADAFATNGLRVTLGHSGNIGQVGYALGHVDAFSVGIGMREKVNLAGDYSRQALEPKLDENGKKIGGGGWEGVYIPALAMTLSKARAEVLLGHSDLRTRIGRCRIGACAASLTGPLEDHRTHYMHAKAAEVALLQNTPAPWQAEAEAKRLGRALELRELVNKEYKRRGEKILATRTLESLVDDIGEAKVAAVS